MTSTYQKNVNAQRQLGGSQIYDIERFVVLSYTKLWTVRIFIYRHVD